MKRAQKYLLGLLGGAALAAASYLILRGDKINEPPADEKTTLEDHTLPSLRGIERGRFLPSENEKKLEEILKQGSAYSQPRKSLIGLAEKYLLEKYDASTLKNLNLPDAILDEIGKKFDADDRNYIEHSRDSLAYFHVEGQDGLRTIVLEFEKDENGNLRYPPKELLNRKLTMNTSRALSSVYSNIATIDFMNKTPEETEALLRQSYRDALLPFLWTLDSDSERRDFLSEIVAGAVAYRPIEGSKRGARGSIGFITNMTSGNGLTDALNVLERGDVSGLEQKASYRAVVKWADGKGEQIFTYVLDDKGTPILRAGGTDDDRGRKPGEFWTYCGGGLSINPLYVRNVKDDLTTMEDVTELFVPTSTLNFRFDQNEKYHLLSYDSGEQVVVQTQNGDIAGNVVFEDVASDEIAYVVGTGPDASNINNFATDVFLLNKDGSANKLFTGNDLRRQQRGFEYIPAGQEIDIKRDYHGKKWQLRAWHERGGWNDIAQNDVQVVKDRFGNDAFDVQNLYHNGYYQLGEVVPLDDGKTEFKPRGVAFSYDISSPERRLRLRGH